MTEPVFPTPEEIDSIYADLQSMTIVLDADPIQFGPKRLNMKTATCRNHLNRIEILYLQYSNFLQKAKRMLLREKTSYDLALKNLLANDPEVRNNRNVIDREAMAVMKLREQKEQIDELEIVVADIEAVLTIIRAKRIDLKDVQGRLKDQLRLVESEIRLGSRWGSDAPLPSVPMEPRLAPVDTPYDEPIPEVTEDESMEALARRALAMVDDSSLMTVKLPPLAVKGTNDGIEHLFEDDSLPNPQPSMEDVDSFLSQLELRDPSLSFGEGVSH